MFRRSKFVLAAAVFSAIGFSGHARGDEVQLKNGDRLTGSVVSEEGGKLKFKSKLAGTVEIDVKDIKTLSTEAPVKLKLKDGTILEQPLGGGKEGEVNVKPIGGGGAAAQTVPLSSVKSINQNESWNGNITAGGLITRGNSDTDAFNLSFDVNRRTDNDRFDINGQYLFGRQRDQNTGDKTTTTDNWRIGAKYDYFLTQKLYAFGSFQVEKDRIADLDIRLTPAAGVGYQWVERKDFNFSTEAGLAYVYEKFSNDGSNENVSLKLAYHVDKQLTDGVSVFHNLTFFPSLQNINDYLLLTDAGIRASLTEKMFAEFKAELRYDANPAPGASRSDLRYILGVGWNF